MGELNNVNHPSHYNREGSMECIDEMLLVFGKQAVMNFCLCNSWKYRYRAADKNGAEDLAKSDWYLRKYKELKDENKIRQNALDCFNECNNEDYWFINGILERKPE